MGIQNTTANRKQHAHLNVIVKPSPTRKLSQGLSRQSSRTRIAHEQYHFCSFLFVAGVAMNLELEHVTLCPSIVHLRVRAGIVNSALSRGNSE